MLENKHSSIDKAEYLGLLREYIDNLKTAVSVLESIQDVENYKLLKNLELNIPKDGIDLYESKQAYETSLIKHALSKTNGNQRKAAKLLKMNTTTLNSIIKTRNIAT